MARFIATIKKFNSQGEKTGWTYIEIPGKIAEEIFPGNRKSFRVKGKLDDYSFNGLSTLPMGNGDFILALNATIRKAIRKSKGADVTVEIQHDKKPLTIPAWFMECINDEPSALTQFNKLPPGHQRYFIKWIESAKTEPTRVKRIAQAITSLSRQMGFPEMMRSLKKVDN